MADARFATCVAAPLERRSQELKTKYQWLKLIKKKQAAQGEARAAWLAKSSGEEGKLFVEPYYIDDGLFWPVVVGAPAGCVLSPTVLVIRRTSTRRLSARPEEVLFDSTGLSLPSPIT